MFDLYFEKQKDLREEYENMEKLMVEARINKLINAGGVKSNLF